MMMMEFFSKISRRFTQQDGGGVNGQNGITKSKQGKCQKRRANFYWTFKQKMSNKNVRNLFSLKSEMLFVPIFLISLFLLNESPKCLFVLSVPIITFFCLYLTKVEASDDRRRRSSGRSCQSSTFTRGELHKYLLASSLLMTSIFGSAAAIRITSVAVPSYPVSGEPVELECHYDLEEDVLYSVKWYRGTHEFFRYVPGDAIPIQIFDIKGVLVNTALSDNNKVTLRSVTRESSGKYRCEVSADAPSFHTTSKAAEMLVVDLPNSVPNITGGRTRYHVGDEVHVNCTSAKSRPAASLMWYINSKPAKIESLVEYAPVQDADGLEISRLGLRLYVGTKDFPDGVLRLRCTATIAAVYWQSSEEAVEGHLPQTSPALESKGVYTGSSTPVGFSYPAVLSTSLLQGGCLWLFLFR